MAGCDPLKGKLVDNSNQLTTYYVTEVLQYPGMIGLWFAALFAGSLSTMSTGFNSASAIIWEDLLKDRLRDRLTPKQLDLTLKGITFFLGVLSCIVAMCFENFEGSIVKLTSSTVFIFGASVFLCYLCGALFPFVNATGILFGMLSSTLATGFLSFGQSYFDLSSEELYLPSSKINCANQGSEVPTTTDDLLGIVVTSKVPIVK